MISIKDGRTELFQWDTGVVVKSTEPCDQFHFTNKVFGKTLDVVAKSVDGTSEAPIPDILLQANNSIKVYAYVLDETGKKTKEELILKVLKRNKPNDYIYERIDPNDLAKSLNALTGQDYSGLTWEELNEVVKSLDVLSPAQQEEIDAMALIRTLAESVNIHNGNYGLWQRNPHTPDIPFKLPYLYTPNAPFETGCFNSFLTECGFDFSSGTFGGVNRAFANTERLEKVTVTGVEHQKWAQAFYDKAVLTEVNIFDSIERKNPASLATEFLTELIETGKDSFAIKNKELYMRMFQNCRKLEKIVAIFDLTGRDSEDLNAMFLNCNKLRYVRFAPLTLGKLVEGDSTLSGFGASLSITSPDLVYQDAEGNWNNDSLVSLVNAVVPNRGITLILNSSFHYEIETPPLRLWMTPNDETVTDTTLYHVATQEEYNLGKARYYESILSLNKGVTIRYTE